jgi:hypothetical protein
MQCDKGLWRSCAVIEVAQLRVLLSDLTYPYSKNMLDGAVAVNYCSTCLLLKMPLAVQKPLLK